MGYLSSLGKATKNTFLKSEGDKLSEEFTVAAANTVKQGQPVKMNNTGEVLPWTTADGDALLIGIAMTDQAAGELVTVWTRGYMIVMCLSAAALNCGPVTHSSFDSSTVVGGTSGYNKVGTATVTSGVAAGMIGWALDDTAGADEIIRVLIKN